MSAYIASLVSVIGINLILALSLNIITGFCGQVSLGHAAFYGIGAYTAAYLAKLGAPLPLTLLAGAAMAGAIGIVVGLTSLRVRHDFLAVTTMGIGFVFLGFVRKQKWLGGELGISGIPGSGLDPVSYAVLIVAFAAAVMGFCLWIKHSWMGFTFDAVADDEDAARTVGVNVSTYKLVAFGIGTALAGLAGGLYVYFARIILPDTFDFVQSIAILTMVVIGGTGSVWGVFAATIALTLLPEVSRAAADYRLLIFGAMLILVMRFSPGGLASLVRRKPA
ncbi:branched-chain amino acid ABC transporter permease [Reyranella sp. CPCC 100927]|uniref:branched-chain amino acid ABC transporter permease n=1 Tax=Reyranella sp. CPCC 100927 TaxID=2599616 RepID=UPI0011B5AC21|nr:branched-chain amino acid ABC transporter permease [Reyranella sp. CPCC 100927]TWT12537.1 branched-chain amino acid ABC transporter permease [Reyranella sp. CPCC 100927]